MLEKLIIENCAPTLANLKTGEIVNYRFADLAQAKQQVKELSSRLESQGVNIEILIERQTSLLLYVYRRNRLACDLSCPMARSFLEKEGYGTTHIDNMVQMLKMRINADKNANEFPHEIGLFLSYPIEDVKGFIENNGRNCRCCGYWKVYDQEERAISMFAKFDRCKAVYRRMCKQGTSINKLIVAR